MADINILSTHVADLIAAGEVVERPASVIKELVENSFDAGASSIKIELKDGGMTYIRVTDDGCGMLPEDAGVCFMRHATSKLHDERGLERIGTMGFRGEALAAIAAVSRIELLTRKKGAENGTRVMVDAGEITEMTSFGCPEGTTMIVRDLFHNTPARQKFMKTDRAESAACTNTALRCALGRPEVSVRLIRDGREEFFSPGDGRQDSCVYSLLGRDVASGFLPCNSSEDDISVSGFISSPSQGHGNRAKQFFFCNGRSIRSALLQSAVEQAYKNTLLTGRFPACAIWLVISPAAVDVNVHPAKTEVRFREERRVFDAVYYSALAALQGERRAPEALRSYSEKVPVSTGGDTSRNIPTFEFRHKEPETAEGTLPDRGTIIIDRRPSAGGGTSLFMESISPYFSGKSTGSAAYRREKISRPETPSDGNGSDFTAPFGQERYRLVGEAMKTYIIVDAGDSILLIDKHAAHERIIFDRLKEQERDIMSQSLLEPLTVKLDPNDMDLVEKNCEKLGKFGLDLAPFGEDSVILRGVPADTDVSDAAALVEELCEKLRSGLDIASGDMTDEILHTIACKAAIKAGWNTTEEELQVIVDEVVSGRIKYCPHGRPVSVTLTKKQLDKEFSRIV